MQEQSLKDIALRAYGGKEPGHLSARITLKIGIKRCCICREWKYLTDFSTSKSRGDGYDNKCRTCLVKYRKEWVSRPANKHKYAEYTRKSRYGSKEARERNRHNRLRDRCRAFGITVEQYEKMYAEQNGCCAMCGKSEKENGRQLAIDHDHSCCPEPLRSCGKCIRGLLCSDCNVALGYYESTLKKELARQYLTRVQNKNPVGRG